MNLCADCGCGICEGSLCARCYGKRRDAMLLTERQHADPAAEIAALKHDIGRYVAISADLATQLAAAEARAGRLARYIKADDALLSATFQDEGDAEGLQRRVKAEAEWDEAQRSLLPGDLEC